MAVFALPQRQADAQTPITPTITPTIDQWTPSPTAGPSPTITPSFVFVTPGPTNFFLIGGTQTVTPTAVANGACPNGEWSPDGLHPDWAAVCAACLPAAGEDVIAAAAASVTVPAVTIPAIFFDNYTLLEPTMSPSSTVTPAVTPAVTPTCGASSLTMWSGASWPSPLVEGQWNGSVFSDGVFRATNLNNDNPRGYYRSGTGVSVTVTWYLPYAVRANQLQLQAGASRSCDVNNRPGEVFVNGVSVGSYQGLGLGIDNYTRAVSFPDQYVSVVSVVQTFTCGGSRQAWIGWLRLHSSCSVVATFTPAVTPSSTFTPSPSPTVPFSDGMFSLPPQDCSTPVYVSHEPIVDMAIEVGGDVTCFTIIPEILTNTFSGQNQGIPRIELCVRLFAAVVEIAGIQIDVFLVFAAPLFALLLRWALFN